MKKYLAVAIVAAVTVNLMVSCAPVSAGRRTSTGAPTSNAGTSATKPSTTSAGTSDRGGGGRGVLCLKGGKTSVELLDLFEARSMHVLKLIDAPKTENEAIELFAKLLGEQLWTPGSDSVTERIDYFRSVWKNELMKRTRFLSSKQHLKLSTDSHEPLLEDGCQSVQVALYYDESSLMIDSSLWANMDWLNRTALMAHEFIYKVSRLSGETDSISTRKLVAFLFSNEGLKPLSFGLPHDASLINSCSLIRNGESDGSVLIYDLPAGAEKTIEIVFLKAGSKNYLFRTSLKVWGASAKLISEADLHSNALLQSHAEFHCRNYCSSGELTSDTYSDSLGRYNIGMDEMDRFFLMPAKGDPKDKWILHCGPSNVH